MGFGVLLVILYVFKALHQFDFDFIICYPQLAYFFDLSSMDRTRSRRPGPFRLQFPYLWSSSGILDKQTSGMSIRILTAGTRIFKIQDVEEVEILWRPALTGVVKYSSSSLRIRSNQGRSPWKKLSLF